MRVLRRMDHRARLALTLIRVAAAFILFVHGIARARLGIVDDFGTFLSARGFPYGFNVAWTITIVEVVGGLILAAGYFVRPLAIWFSIELLAGIYLVHSAAGWFVVGAGRNGMEFSVLLISCLAAAAISPPTARALSRGRIGRS
jgi:putative oxidoreductase